VQSDEKIDAIDVTGPTMSNSNTGNVIRSVTRKQPYSLSLRFWARFTKHPNKDIEELTVATVRYCSRTKGWVDEGVASILS
jgi:hypothetical protein